MRARLGQLIAFLLITGCGASPPPEDGQPCDPHGVPELHESQLFERLAHVLGGDPTLPELRAVTVSLGGEGWAEATCEYCVREDGELSEDECMRLCLRARAPELVVDRVRVLDEWFRMLPTQAARARCAERPGSLDACLQAALEAFGGAGRGARIETRTRPRDPDEHGPEVVGERLMEGATLTFYPSSMHPPWRFVGSIGEHGCGARGWTRELEYGGR